MPIIVPDRVTNKETVEDDPRARALYAELPRLKESARGLEYLRQCRVTRIECFLFDDQPFERESDIRGLIALSTNAGIVGCREFAVPRSGLKGDLVMWAAPFQRLKGMNVLESLRFPQLKSETWGADRAALIESALADILDQAAGRVTDGRERRDLVDREGLFGHAQAYVTF
ncbi:hypothetical protein [Paenibacillus sp. GCM10023250]|uniref:hypothetical protein n=1 Tax=Paenibacillus sp. GCM10023250 TaxID=3252648 RepID=UPI003623A617